MSFTPTIGLVSIVVPAYNSAKHLRQCLDSLTHQTYKDIEVIILNDASTDATDQVINEWKDYHDTIRPTSQVIYLTMPRNTGYAGAYTTGMFLAKGEFIAMQDSDDYSHPNRIARQVEFLRNHPRIELVGTRYYRFKDGTETMRPNLKWLRFGVVNVRKRYKAGRHCICIGSTMFRRSVFDRVGGFVRLNNRREDFRWALACFRHKVVMDNIPQLLYYYRTHPTQRSKRFRRLNKSTQQID